MSLLVQHLPSEVSFTYCRICGSYFTHADLTQRRMWSFKHAESHSYKQHNLLHKSGLWLLPEAAYRLATLGVIPLKDMVLDNEVEHALLESKPFGSRPPPM